MQITKVFSFSFLFFLLLAVSSSASPTAKRILSLVDYVGGDYQNAIKNGEIINDAEYLEMLDFSSEIQELFKSLTAAGGDQAGIESDLNNLNRLITEKSSVEDVEILSSSIKDKLITSYNIVPYPKRPPSYVSGQNLYTATCAQCHGAGGAGDGPLAKGLTPPPTIFTAPDVLGGLTPFKVFNTISFGIEGTAMPQFPQIPEDEKWDVAFYVLSLGVNKADSIKGVGIVADLPEELRGYKALATISNGELEEELIEYTEDEQERDLVVAYLRGGILNKNSSQVSSLLFAGSLLNSAVELYRNGDKQEAYVKTLDAYLEGFEKVETELFIKDEKLTVETESGFADLRGAIKSGEPISEIESINESLQSKLNRATVVFENGEPAGRYISFVNSFAIIVREGLEAIFIIAAIIAFLGATGARRSIKYIHYGWILAIVAGIGTWFLAMKVITISGAQREVIEGVTALIAAAVLFYVSYWLISKIEATKWKRYITDKVERAVTKKSVIALASVSFFAVYREAFETVLFYQALWFQAEESQSAVVWGFVAGAAVLVVLFFIIFKLALRIPIKYFFSFTSTFLYLLSFILMGKGIRELQEAGVVDITPVNFLPQIDALGVYPTLETAIPQGVLILAVVFAVIWVIYVKREREKSELAVSVSRISEDMKSMQHAFDHIKGHIVEWRRCDEIDLEAEDLEHQIEDVIKHVDELENKLGDFYDVVSKNAEPAKSSN